MKDVSDYYNKSSFGKLSIATTVTPLVMMPHDGKWYQANDTSNGGSIDCLGLTHNDARAAAKALGYDPANYGVIIVLQSYGYGISRGAGGWGSVSETSVWIYSSTWREVVAHEMGHTFGLAHANYWDTGGLSAVGNGTNQEYGDIYDIMGGGDITTSQYNVGQGTDRLADSRQHDHRGPEQDLPDHRARREHPRSHPALRTQDRQESDLHLLCGGPAALRQ